MKESHNQGSFQIIDGNIWQVSFGKALDLSAVGLRYYDILNFWTGGRSSPVDTLQMELPGSHKDIMSDTGVENE